MKQALFASSIDQGGGKRRSADRYGLKAGTTRPTALEIISFWQTGRFSKFPKFVAVQESESGP
jgi:hypothetical protein